MGCLHLCMSLLLLTAAHGQVLYYPTTPEKELIEEGCKAGLDHPAGTQVALFEVEGAFFLPTYSENEDDYTENCSTLILQPDNTTTAVGRLIFILPLEDNSTVCRDILFFVNGSNPVVCLYYTMEKDEITLEIDKRPAVTTIVITSISLIASIILLVTYTIFPSLRTLPSKVIMNLSLSFLLGDAFVITVTALVLAEEDMLVIDIVGVISFYFFHARFLWMALSGFEMCRTVLVGTRLRFDTQYTRRRLLIGYMLFGWAVPFVPTTIMASVHFASDNRQSTFNILFGIGGFIVTLVPVGLVILFNIGVLISFSCFLRKAYQWETQLRDALTMHQTKRTTNFTRIFIVVLSILGLSWVTILLIYVDGVQSTEAVLITYNILNASQPIFVSAAFIATKKILRKYLSLCGYKKCDEKRTRRSRRRGRRLFSFIFTDRELSSIRTYSFSKKRQNSGVSATSMLTSMNSSSLTASNGSNSPALKLSHTVPLPQLASDGSDSPTVNTPSTPSAPLPQLASDGSNSPTVSTDTAALTRKESPLPQPSSDGSTINTSSIPSTQPASDDTNSPTVDISSDTAVLTRKGSPDIVTHVPVDFKETTV